jgi:hypothetical protein
VPVSGLLHSQAKHKSQVSEACRESSHKIQANPASIEFGFSLLRIDERIDDDALVDCPWDRGSEPRLWDSSCVIILGPQPVQMPGAEGEAARRDRLLPTGHR